MVPTLRARAVESLGAAPVTAASLVHEELLPPAPEAARLAPAPGSAVELAEELGALLATEGDVTAFERVLDGLVRHAYEDREALLEALGPVVARRWWADAAPGYPQRPDDHFSRSHHAFGSAAYLSTSCWPPSWTGCARSRSTTEPTTTTGAGSAGTAH